MALPQMSFKIEVDNTGLALSELTDACKRAMEICGGKAETYAKKICPVDTGRLRASITHQVAQDGRSVDVGTNVNYAPFVELGTYRQRAQPYIRPSIENHMQEYKGIIEIELKKG